MVTGFHESKGRVVHPSLCVLTNIFAVCCQLAHLPIFIAAASGQQLIGGDIPYTLFSTVTRDTVNFFICKNKLS